MQKNARNYHTKRFTQSRKDAKGKIINDFFIFAYFLNSTILLIQLIKILKSGFCAKNLAIFTLWHGAFA